MAIRITMLNSQVEDKYEAFLHQSPLTLFYTSNKYRLMIKKFTKTEDNYFIALDDNNEIVGALPSFLKKNKMHGNVLNSLPFYGSNGGIIEFKNNTNVWLSLISAFYNFSEQNDCVTSTIIISPFEKNIAFYEKESNYTFRDERIGQLTKLPSKSDLLNDGLMKIFHSKTRNIVRKVLKSELTIRDDDSTNSINFLSETHKNNIDSIGGLAKPKSFFDLIPRIFKYGTDYKIWMAYYKDHIPVAALLLFYFNKTVEYFTPVVVENYRSLQPLSLLIFEAMKDAIYNSYEWWNWGGTWKSQKGVYHFKKRWGTVDYPYFYYTKIRNPVILSCAKEELLAEYTNFYVAPFEKLKYI